MELPTEERVIPRLSSSSGFLLREKASINDYTFTKVPKYKKVKGRKVKKGEREICAPSDSLKALQKDIISQLKVFRIGVHPCAHAYRNNRSIVTMAENHVNKRRLLRIDLKDFFPSVKEAMVLSRLPKSVPRNLVEIIKNWCFLNGRLPQGAPSSPLLSNIALFGLDTQIAGLCAKWRHVTQGNPNTPNKLKRVQDITYTRYCDDLVFSSNYPFLHHMIKPIQSLISRNGLKVNEKKIIHSTYSARQYVTGIVVNEKMSCPKDVRKNLRAELNRCILDTASGKCPALHKLDIDGNVVPLNETNESYPFAQLEGKVAFVKMICPEQAVSLEKQLNILIEVHSISAENWSDATSEYTKKIS